MAHLIAVDRSERLWIYDVRIIYGNLRTVTRTWATIAVTSFQRGVTVARHNTSSLTDSHTTMWLRHYSVWPCQSWLFLTRIKLIHTLAASQAVSGFIVLLNRPVGWFPLHKTQKYTAPSVIRLLWWGKGHAAGEKDKDNIWTCLLWDLILSCQAANSKYGRRNIMKFSL